MKLEVKSHITIDEPVFGWTFTIIPSIFIKHGISLSGGATVTMIIFQWLVGQLILCFIKEREEIPLGECNIRVD